MSDDEQRAQDEAAEHAQFFLGKRLDPPHFLITPGCDRKFAAGFLAARLGEGPTIGNAIAGTPKTVLDKLIADYDYLDGFATLLWGRAGKRHARANDEAYDALPTGSDASAQTLPHQKTDGQSQ